MTVEHLKPLLDNFRNTKLFCQVWEHLAQGKIPKDVLCQHGSHDGALQKQTAEFVGWGRRHGETFGHKDDCSTDPRSNGEGDIPVSLRVLALKCMSHAIQAITDADLRATM